MKDSELIKQKLIESIILQDSLTFEGKHRLAGRYMDIINEITDQIKSGQLDKTILVQLCCHDNMNVKHIAAMELLRMNYMIDIALETLTSVANSEKPVISLVAGWQLNWWKESGTIDPPNKGKSPTVPKKKKRNDNLPTFEPAIANYEELNENQRVAYLASRYDGEVNNGGHYQYFENQGTEHTKETINALKIIGARKQSKILEEAFEMYLSKNRQHPTKVDEFAEEERKGEFGKLDNAFYDCKTEINNLVDEYLEKNHL